MITKDKLSIIIPCYNCEKTIKEAVDSIYTQKIEIPFEIIMVDDCSTDNTKKVINDLSKEYKEIKLIYNDKNKGGGATRNIAVKHSDGEIIFCLDSDDFLGAGSLGKMIEFWREKKSDGVTFNQSIKFNCANKTNVYRTDTFDFESKPIPMETFFGEKLCPLFTVFLFTRKSFDMIDGYPENHGFDTQGFGFKYFMNNLKVYSCPQTTYWHRVGLPQSYYIREYESGKVNHNWYLLLEEFLYIFDDKVKEKILNWNLNAPYIKDNLGTLVKKVKIEEDKKSLITHFTKEEYQKKVNLKIASNYDKYWLGTYFFYKKDYLEAQKIFEGLLKINFETNYIHFYLDKCIRNTKINSDLLDKRKIDALFKFKTQGKKIGIITRIQRKLINTIFKN